MSTKERLEIEVAAQRATLQEQRAHISVLDNALANAHSNILRTEEEVRLFILYTYTCMYVHDACIISTQKFICISSCMHLHRYSYAQDSCICLLLLYSHSLRKKYQFLNKEVIRKRKVIGTISQKT